MSFVIGTPHTKGAGYAMNDDRNSGGKLTEADVQTCPHCQAVIKMQEWKTASIQNFCNRCMKPTCNHPNCVDDCVPFLKFFERHYDAIVKFKDYLRNAGLEPTSPPKPLIRL